MIKKWLKAALFLLPLFIFTGWVNWYVDSYALLRVTYDEIAAQMAAGKHVEGLEDSDYNDRNLLAARLKDMEEAPQIMVLGSSRVYTFDHTMFGTESFYNAGLSEATIYDLLAVAGIAVSQDRLPETAVIGVDAFLFNKSHDNEKWKELGSYADYMSLTLDGKLSPELARPRKDTGRDWGKTLSLDYFRYNVTLLPDRKRFSVSYTDDWETEGYLKHCDGSVSYQRELREVNPADVEEMTEQAMEEHVVYRMTDYAEIDEGHFSRLSELADYLLEAGVEVILYLPPYSPMMYNYIESEEAFQITLEVEERVKNLAVEKGIALYGSYDPAGCGLEMADLYDVYHVKTEKTAETYYPVILPR
ncbi:MAG: hypothetical protein K2H37_02620 [Lachnospiraceae bacterium]|nr:hypothetical protein [Lachnospiraceae bacterium]